MSARETIIEAMSWCEDFDTGRWGAEKAEALLAAYAEHIRADQNERIAVAIEAMPIGGFTPAEGERLRGVCETIEESARIARATGSSL